MSRQRKTVLNGFLVFVALVSLLNLVLNLINGRFHPGDFQVYHTAATRFLSGDTVYGISYYSGSGLYKYSPATLFFFLPYAMLPYKAAAVIHILILSAAYWWCFIVIAGLLRRSLLNGPANRDTLLLSLGFICILLPMSRELYLGNINMLLLLSLVLALRDFLDGKAWRGGILLGLAILAKPYLAVFLIPLFLRRQWKPLLSTLTVTCAGLLLPFLYPGPSGGTEMYRAWISTMLMHREDFPGMTSLGYIAGHYLPGWPSWGDSLLALLLLSGVVLLIIVNGKREKAAHDDHQAESDQVFEWFLLAGLLPNMIRTDWVLLIFSAPLILFIIFRIAQERQWRLIPVLVLLVSFYGANSDDLLGRELSRTILHAGLMGLANFLLAAMAFLLFIRSRREPPPHAG